MNNLTHVLHDGYYYFIWQPFVERFALWYWTLSVYDVGVSWPDSSMDQDETWYGGRPRPRPHCVRWGPSFPSLTTHKRDTAAPNFRPMSVLAKRLDGSRCHLVWIMEVGLGQDHIVLDGDRAPPKGQSPQFSAHVCCGQTAGWIKMPLDTEVGLGPGLIALDGDPTPCKKGAMSIVAKRHWRLILRMISSCFNVKSNHIYSP